MGVPAFFRWLSRKYPSIIVNCVEERPKEVNDTKIPVDSTKPNPNFQEFDNLYLDMNGIIHPCTHPEHCAPPKNEDEMFVLIFEYIDRLFSIVRPRRLLYMAIDGVAPRAKMNQQRSRRFRASKEAAEKKEEILHMRRKLENEGIPLPPPKKAEEHFDSNCITPGTPFMARLADALRYYVHLRVTHDPAWKNITVILSDANAPGEGEHKIMDFVRRQRASPSHDPNTVHCLCGADADLIMLGLATHEANFNIIREEFVPNQPRPCELCAQYGHELKDCKGLAAEELHPDQCDPLSKETNFIFLRLPVLREYLERELVMPNLPFPYDLERAIDDWVFMCFFVGNDFLPHLPSLEIRENAIDRLIKLYKDMVYKTGGWLTDSGEVYLDRVQIMMKKLGEVEDEIFKNRQAKEQRFRAMNKQKRRQQREHKRRTSAPVQLPKQGSLLEPKPVHQSQSATYMSGAETRQKAYEQRTEDLRCAEASAKLKDLLSPVGTKRPADPAPLEDQPKAKERESEKSSTSRTLPSTTEDSDSEPEPNDEVRLWESGWKDRYYQMKFGVSESDVNFRHRVAYAYAEGLCWVLKYYYQGCASWNWYFPFHYAPFASDFDTVGEFKPDFSKPTRPFKPLEQLMGVFPAASRDHIPKGWRELMTSEDSPIIDFYPPDFEIDLNGKKFAWQGVALLPFVDETRLLDALNEVYDTLTNDEKARNIRGPDRIFVGKSHPLFSFLVEIYENGKNKTKEHEQECPKGSIEIPVYDWTYIDPQLCNGMAGQVAYDKAAVAPGERYVSMFRNVEEYLDIKNNQCIVAAYRDPPFDTNYKFETTRLDGIKELERVLKPKDWDDRRNGQFQPMIGFSRNVPRGRLSDSGHRMIQHEIREQNYQQRSDGSQHTHVHREFRQYGPRGQVSGYSNFDSYRGPSPRSYGPPNTYGRPPQGILQSLFPPPPRPPPTPFDSPFAPAPHGYSTPQNQRPWHRQQPSYSSPTQRQFQHHSTATPSQHSGFSGSRHDTPHPRRLNSNAPAFVPRGEEPNEKKARKDWNNGNNRPY
uniref:5'-3' exoribonuclease n=1 Tax=Acrobeloides nanus TaxID=290746 RepID=A0A914BXC7_9BILA